MRVFGPYAPDRPDLHEGTLVEALNVVPRTDRSYGPLQSPEPHLPALEDRALGMFAGQDPTGNVSLFAGTAAKLWRFEGEILVEAPFSDQTFFTDGTGFISSTEDNRAWIDVSDPPGYTVGGDDRWVFVIFGDRVIAAGGVNDPLQSVILGTSTAFEELSEDAPHAKHIAVVGDFIMVGNTLDPVDDRRPNRVWWSGINDPTAWPTPGSDAALSVMSDFQDLQGGGAVQAIVPGVGGADAVVFGERRIWRVQFEGPPTFFGFYVAETARGALAPGSVAAVGGLVYYIAPDGLFAFDGARSVPIGESTVSRFLLTDLDIGQLQSVWSAVDMRRSLVIWAYPGAGTLGVANRCLLYHWQTGRWSRAELEIEALAGIQSVGYTLEGLASFGLSLDELPFSLDDPSLKGGAAFLGIVGPDHVLQTLTGSPMEAELETADITAFGSGAGGQRRMFVRGGRLYTDAPASLVRVRGRTNLSEEYSETAFAPPGPDRLFPSRTDAWFVRLGAKIPAGTEWQHLQGFDLDARPSGKR